MVRTTCQDLRNGSQTRFQSCISSLELGSKVNSRVEFEVRSQVRNIYRIGDRLGTLNCGRDLGPDLWSDSQVLGKDKVKDSIPLNLPGTTFYKAIRATNVIRKELLQFVRKRREALEQKTASPSQDILSHLLSCSDENGKYMSELLIANNILLLLFAGHDTSSVTLTLLIKTLAEHPQVYQNILQEHIEIASSKKEGEFLNWDDIQKMKYSWNVISEVMRITPPILGAYREAIVDINYEGYHIPKGWKLYWNTGLTVGKKKEEKEKVNRKIEQKKEVKATAKIGQVSESLFNINKFGSRDFPQSNEVGPSRFERAGPAPYAYVTFGGGPRMCLGKEFARLEMLIFLHVLIRKFTWKLLIPNEKFIYDPMPTPLQGLPISLQPHN
ncbi:hypothetical protein MTR67_002191 [Solanum verrucosum]|uniref:Cytochrome P450 n=1 Tax=Solanum verrucosum TaxID=315347 RepID=A0AAF0PQG4_SOLVR|nr:hypothetical protein MTR67_002191 [Solanum verrucosum]